MTYQYTTQKNEFYGSKNSKICEGSQKATSFLYEITFNTNSSILDLAKSGLFPRDSISFEEEVDTNQLSQKNVPPVKKKMLWKQKKKSYQQKSILFSTENPEEIKFKEEELEVPKERLFKSKLKVST